MFCGRPVDGRSRTGRPPLARARTSPYAAGVARRGSAAQRSQRAPDDVPGLPGLPADPPVPVPTPRELAARRLAVAVLVVEAVGLSVPIALGARALARHDVTADATAVGLLVFLALAVGALAALARAVARGRRWASAPSITVQLFALFAVGPVLAGLRGWLGGAMAALAVVGGVALVVQARSLPAPRRFDDRAD